MQIDGLYAQNPDTGADNRIPDSWFQQGVRPYFDSWINGGQHTPTRWHWDRIAVNPHDENGTPVTPSASPSFCLGQTNNTCPDKSVDSGSVAPSATFSHAFTQAGTFTYHCEIHKQMTATITVSG